MIQLIPLKKLKKCKTLLTLSVFAFYTIINAQDQSFESRTVPNNWNAGIGNLTTSTNHYKLGTQSLKWDWASNDVLTISNLQNNGLVPSQVLDYFNNMFRIWVYNTSKIANEPLTFEFYDTNGVLQFYYDFQLNFTGWRAASTSYRYEMLGKKLSSNITTLKIKAPTSGSGAFYFDYIDYTMERNTYRSPDYQLPFLALNNGKHWSDMMYFQSLPKIPLTTPTVQELIDFNSIKQKYDNIILGNAPNTSKINNAINSYNSLKIKNTGAHITGVPLYGKDYPDYQNIDAVEQFIHVFARDYKHKSTPSSLNYFINTVKYMLDQGYADGSLMETVHHIGYSFRNIPNAIHLMKQELMAEGLWDEARKMVEWYSAVDIIWHPTAHDSNLDDANTRAMAILGACLYKSTAAEKVQYLKGYKGYLENWLTTYSKEGSGMKVDFTGFHHNTYYPGYTYAGYKSIAQVINLISEGNFTVGTVAHTTLKNALLVARVVTASSEIPNSLSGRNPFITPSFTNGLKDLGLSNPIDGKLLEAYNYLAGSDPETSSYTNEVPPTGFWQINFSNLGAYRQSNWVADIKGFNKYFWGTEIYETSNRFGRYQSYGAIEIMYPGGHTKSGFTKTGWDWNKTPGATTIHLSWNDLEATKDRQDEITESNFAASLRFGDKSNYYIDEILEGIYGVFGMDFIQKPISATHNLSFKFKKSVFCFDGKLICLGSNISNNDNTNITATNLFQNSITTTIRPIIINNTSHTSFPYNNTLNGNINNWLIDAQNTGYYVKSGNPITVDRKNQDSPNQNGNGSFTNGNFASAYINHGMSPNNSGYEYVIIPATDDAEMASFSNNMSNANTAFYEVVQKNKSGHIVSYNDMYGYALFEASSYPNTQPLKSNDSPCLLMIKESNDKLSMSVVNPDLNFANSSNGESLASTLTFKVHGNWSLDSSFGGNVVLSDTGVTETTITIEAKDGLPVDITLNKDALSTHGNNHRAPFQIYPNPTNGSLFINTESLLGHSAELNLFDVHGKQVYRKSYKNLEELIHIENLQLANGIYFLKIKTPTSAFSKKIIYHKK
ncbi:chondroitinase family polysaccharide lyase [Mariniflexile ostreae]|uniref:Chondroitinase family polysaccharide lyase n=1 Tax=Mariniflexile ostreae TaxID=1520892 RepID=A0ABV5FF66_9FLAO